jgi:hypothetical protein
MVRVLAGANPPALFLHPPEPAMPTTASIPRINQRTAHVPTKDILVDWTHRYRHGDWSEEKRNEIAASLLDPAKGGLLYPIILDEQRNLRAGGHRLSAFIELAKRGEPCPFPQYKNWTAIPSFTGTGFSPAHWAAIEHAENFLRREISWFARAKMIYEFHQERRAEDYRWTPKQTAALLSITPETSAWSISIMDLYTSDDEADLNSAAAIQRAPTFRAAYEIARRRNERLAEAEREAIHTATRKAIATPSSPPKEGAIAGSTEGATDSPKIVTSVSSTGSASSCPPAPACPIHHTTLAAFTASWTGSRFNLIHCDPPYGIDRDTSNGQGSRQDTLKYTDTEEDFWNYLSDLSIFCTNHAADSAHLLLWLPPDLWRVAAVMEQLHDLFPTWKLDPTPFIWQREDSAGVAPAPAYSGRRTYEWAIILNQGSRKIVQVRDMLHTCAYGRNQRIHESEKPFSLIRHFASMYVDSTTIAIDPTAGSGRPLQAIHSLGAAQVIGLEREEEIAARAMKDWARYTEQANISASL